MQMDRARTGASSRWRQMSSVVNVLKSFVDTASNGRVGSASRRCTPSSATSLVMDICVSLDPEASGVLAYSTPKARWCSDRKRFQNHGGRIGLSWLAKSWTKMLRLVHLPGNITGIVRRLQ